MTALRLIAAVLAVVVSFFCDASPAIARTAVQHVAGTTIEGLAKPALRAVRLDRDATLSPVSRIPDQTVPAGALALVAQSAIVTPSYVNVPVEMDVDGRYLRTVFVGYRVVRYVRTAVASRDLVAGTVLASDDLEVARIPFTGQRPNGMQALIGRKIVATFRAGAPVFIEETQSNQIVKAGASVVLIVRDAGVSVVADVVARTGGGLGDEVNIYNPQTNKTLTGTVVGPDRVELNLSGGTL